METNPPLVTVDEVARVLGVRRWAVYQWAAEGRIPCVRAGRKVRFVVAEVIAALHHASDGNPAPRPARVATPRAPARRRTRAARAPTAPDAPTAPTAARPRPTPPTTGTSPSAPARAPDARPTDPARLVAAAASARVLGKTPRAPDGDREG